MGQVESSEADESGPTRSDSTRPQPTQHNSKLSQSCTPKGSKGSGGHRGRQQNGRPYPQGSVAAGKQKYIAGQSPLSATGRRQRPNSESESTTTTTSVTTEHNIPIITITEYPDSTDTDLDFSSACYQTSERKADNYKDKEDMDLGIEHHYSSSMGGRRSSEIHQSQQQQKQQKQQHSNSSRTASASASASAHAASSGAGSKAKMASRRRSDSSESSKSNKSSHKASGLIKKNKKRVSEDKKKKLGIAGKNDPKGSLADRWQNIVTEFQDTYVDDNNDKKKAKKDERRVSRLSMEQYNNVKQVFSNSMPLPMQMAPGPGAKVEDIEADASGIAGMAVNSYSAIAPAKRGSTERRQSEERLVSNMSNSNTGKDQRHKSVVAERVITEETTREIVRKKSIAAKEAIAAAEASRASEAASRFSSSHGAHRASTMASGSAHHGSSSAGTTHASSSSRTSRGSHSSGSHSSEAHKKGVKFQSKVTNLEDQARIIVDEAIYAALEVMGIESSSSSRNKSSSKTSGAHSSSRSERQTSVEIAAAEEKRRAEQSKLLSSGYIRESKSRNITETYEERVSSGKSKAKSGKLGQHEFLPLIHEPIAKRSGSMRPIAGAGKTGSGSPVDNLYDMTMQPHYLRDSDVLEMPPGEINVRRTSTVRIYDDNEDTNTIFPEYIPPSDIKETETRIAHQTRQSVKPPTITRGTVTRVLHEHGELMFVPTASKILSRLRSIPEEDSTSVSEFSTHTWPLAKKIEYHPHNIVTTEMCSSNVSDNILPAASRLPNTEVTYNTLPSGLKLAPNRPDNARISNVTNSNMQPNYIIGSSRLSPEPYAITQAYPAEADMDGQYMLSPSSPRAPLYLDTNQMTHHTMYGSLPSTIQTSIGTPVYIVSPVVSPMETMMPGDPSTYRMCQYDSSQHLPPNMSTTPHTSLQGAAYSNEPIIVADLMGTPMPSEVVTSDYYQPEIPDTPPINMNKRQTLNLYLFNQREKNDKPSISYMAQEVETNVGGQTSQYMDLYLNEDTASERHKNEVREMVIRSTAEDDYEPTGMREVTIFHKQTQTALPASPKPSVPKKKTPVVQRIERKSQQTQRLHQLPPASSPRHVSPKSYHKDTTHYITKERQIEKLPPPPTMVREFSVQTNVSGTLSKQTGLNVTTEGTQTSPPPIPPRQRQTQKAPPVDVREVTKIVSMPQVTEVREMESRRDRSPVRAPPSPSPSPPLPEVSVRDIPLQVRPATRENILEVLEREIQKPPTYEVVAPPSQQLSQPEPASESESSEEEIIEMYEVEEREQRISMAIFEELEFTCSRKEGGTTSSQTAHASSASDLVPWTMPPVYETTVDRRKQKSTQIREVKKEGSQHFHGIGGNRNASTLLEGGGQKHIEQTNHQSSKSINKHQSGHTDNNVHQSSRNIEIKQHVDNIPAAERTITVRQATSTQPTGKNVHHVQRSGINPTSPRRSYMKESSEIWRSDESEIIPSAEDYPSGKVTHHSEEHTTAVNGPSPSGATSSGYSSADSAGGYHSKYYTDYHSNSPELEKVNEVQSQNSTLKRRYVSRFDPENFYFQVPAWPSNDTMYNISKEMAAEGTVSPPSNDDDSLPGTLPDNTNDNSITKSVKSTPKLRTRVVKDEDGNLVKITEVEQTITNTVDYTKDVTEQAPDNVPNKIYEELGGTNYMDVNLVAQELQETVQDEQVEEEEQEEVCENRPCITGPDVVAETTTELHPIEYDTQTTSLGLPEEELRMREYEAQERTLGLEDDCCAALPDQRYLYDMKTATLRPTVTEDSNGKMLMQYSLGDTMITEL